MQSYILTYYIALDSPSFSSKFLQSSIVECVYSSESEFYLWYKYILFRPDMALNGWLGLKYQVSIYPR